MASFEHSVLIPVTVYNQYKDLLKNKDSAEEILMDHHLPADIKMKLYNEERFRKRKSKSDFGKIPSKDLHTQKVTPEDSSKIRSKVKLPRYTIISDFETRDRETIEKILNIIEQNTDTISLNFKKEVIINGKPIVKSNISEILTFLLNKAIITSRLDIPKGAKMTFNTLIEIGVPREWFKIKSFNYQPSKKSGKKKPTWQAFESDSEQYDTSDSDTM